MAGQDKSEGELGKDKRERKKKKKCKKEERINERVCECF